MTASDLAAINDAWPSDPTVDEWLYCCPPTARSGVRAKQAPAKPPLPIRVVVERYLRARLEAEARMDAGERVDVTIGDEVYDVTMVGDTIAADGRVIRRGGLRVERVD